MREVKDLCDQMLEPPKPPMTSPERILRIARRPQRRRRVAGAALLTVAVVAAGVGLPRLRSPQQPPPAIAQSTPSLVSAQSALLAVAQIVSQHTNASGDPVVSPDGSSVYIATGSSFGSAWLAIQPNRVAQSSFNLCAPAVAAAQLSVSYRKLFGVTPTNCETVQIGTKSVVIGTLGPREGFALRQIGELTVISVITTSTATDLQAALRKHAEILCDPNVEAAIIKLPR